MSAVHCCYVDEQRGKPCKKPAKWEIRGQRPSVDRLRACVEHVGELLDDAPKQVIYEIEVPA